MLPVDRRSPLPLWVQIQNQLRVMLSELKPGARFSTDEELARQFHVSRLTVRQAVEDLVREGLLERVQGSGTFVRMPKVTEHLYPHANFWTQWTDQGRKLRVETVDFRFIDAPADVATALQVASGSPVLYLRRLRHLDEEPVALDDRYLVSAVGQLLGRDTVDREPLIRTLPQLGVTLGRNVMEIEATVAKEEEARLLRIRRRTPVLLRTVTYYSATDEPILWGRSIYRADKTKYIVTVAPERP